MDNKKELKRYIVDRALYENEGVVMIVYEMWRSLLDERYDKVFIDAIYQYNHYKLPYPDIYDAYFVCEIQKRFLVGELFYFKIHLGQVPTSDSRVDTNQERLDEGLRQFKERSVEGRDIKAIVVPEKGRGARKDGELSWAESIIGEALDGTIYEIAPDHIPLEIGTTDSITTYQHIVRDGGVARWAYDSEILVLFINLRCDVMIVKKLESKEGLECIDE
nr:hypothetical protein [uncultured Niameybacter sp.]